MTLTAEAWKRLKKNFRAMMAQICIGWALWWSSEEVVDYILELIKEAKK